MRACMHAAVRVVGDGVGDGGRHCCHCHACACALWWEVVGGGGGGGDGGRCHCHLHGGGGGGMVAVVVIYHCHYWCLLLWLVAWRVSTLSRTKHIWYSEHGTYY